MDGFLEGLAQQVLATLRVGDVAVDGQHQVVGDQRVGGGEVAQAAQHDAALVFAEAVLALPGGDVGGHVDFLGHPVVGAAVQVLLPGPVVLEGHQLVQVGAAVDHGLLVHGDTRRAHLQFFQAGRDVHIGDAAGLASAISGIFVGGQFLLGGICFAVLAARGPVPSRLSASRLGLNDASVAAAGSAWQGAC